MLDQMYEEIARLKARIEKLEQLLKKSETYISLPEVVSHEERVSLRESINEVIYEVTHTATFEIPGPATITIPQGIEIKIKPKSGW